MVPETQLAHILFADVSGFSKLREDQLTDFFGELFNIYERQVASHHDKLIYKNTWGDGLVLVSTDIGVIVRIAFDLVQTFETAIAVSSSLPGTLKHRIALHSDFVACVHDPIFGDVNTVGPGMSTCARMEPIAPVGQIVVSSSFRDQIRKSNHMNFEFDDLGEVELPKGYGSLEVSVIRKAGTAAYMYGTQPEYKVFGHDEYGDLRNRIQQLLLGNLSARPIYISASKLQFMGPLLSGITREIRNKITEIRIKTLSEDVYSKACAAGLFDGHEMDVLNHNIADLRSKLNVPVYTSVWAQFPLFHGFLYDEFMFEGDWEVREGKLAAETTVRWFNRSARPDRFSEYAEELQQGDWIRLQ